MKILFFYKGIPPSYRSIFSFPYALAKHADVKYYGRIGAYTIEETTTKRALTTKKSIPWSTYGYQVRYGLRKRDSILSKRNDAQEIIKNLYPNDYPDAVITTFRPTTSWIPENIEKCECLRVVWSYELHNDFSHSKLGRKRLQWCKDKKFNLVFKSYDPNNRLEQSKWLEDTGVAVEMSTPSVNTDLFYDKKLPKKYDVANIFNNNSPKTYPLRWKIHKTLPKQTQWIYLEANTLWTKGEKTIKYPVLYKKLSGPRGEEYVDTICQSRVFATGSGKHRDYGILVFKWVEIPACNTLLMINALTPSDDMNAMGFEPNVNFAEINENNFLERIQYYLSHPSEARTIAQRGYDLIRSKHSQNIRAKEFIDKIRKHVKE